jgi:hypothetical protein
MVETNPGFVTNRDLLAAVAATLGEAPSLEVPVQFLESLTEGVSDTPLLKLYLDTGAADIAGTGSRTTMGGGVRQHDVVIKGHLFVRQRSQLGEDLAAQCDVWDELEAILDQQNRRGYFGQPGIKEYRYTYTMVTLVFGDPATNYSGVEFLLTLKVF